MMNSKNAEHIKPEILPWQLSSVLVNFMKILTPTALVILVLWHNGILLDFIFNYNYLNVDKIISSRKRDKHSIPKINFFKWLTLLISPKKNKTDTNNLSCRSMPAACDVWQDGSLLCNLVNIYVPGACKDPRPHRMQTPAHGQKLIYDYMNIKPIFSTTELTQKYLTAYQEQKFTNYLKEVFRNILSKNIKLNNMEYSSDYVAKGMGLVVAQQNCKSIFYIYPIPKSYVNPSDIEINIKGPCGNNGNVTVPSILLYKNKCQPFTEYKRALYMSSKLNSISPTLQGTSFFRKLSVNSKLPNEMNIKVKITTTRAKITYVPEKTGIYEINLIINGYHIIGSPFSVPVEVDDGSSKHWSNDSSENEEEKEDKYVYRKKRVISRIVDFIDEKMLLQNDGTLIKIENSNTCNDENHTIFSENKIEENKNIKNTTDVKHNFNSLKNYKNVESNKIPDILARSDSFTKVNDPQIKNKQIVNDPTLAPKVQDLESPNLIYKYNKSFSKKDPSKIEEELCSKSINEKNYFVNNLIKIFDQPLSNTEENKELSSIDVDPDLVTCHIKNNHNINDFSNTNYKQLEIRLQKFGALLENYDKSQCSLKNRLNNKIKVYKAEKRQIIKKNRVNYPQRENILQSELSENKISFVEKQKQFWLNKSVNNNPNNIEPSPRKLIILKDDFIDKSLKSNTSTNQQVTNIPFKGIVENNIKLFEIYKNQQNVNFSSEKKMQKKNISKIYSTKSNSDNLIKSSSIHQKTKEEDIIKIPTLEERKLKFFQACKQSSNSKLSVTKTENKYFIQENDEINKENINLVILQDPAENNNQFNDQKTVDNLCVKRKFRFKRAKNYFQDLETKSNKDLIPDSLKNDVNNHSTIPKSLSNPEKLSSNYLIDQNENLMRTESDPCISISNKKQIPNVSERFFVRNLFHDVLGDSRFPGMPNKTAVVASLASLNANVSHCDNFNLESNLEEDIFKISSKKTEENNNNNIPGFQNTFPHLPKITKWKHRSRTTADLIPRRALLNESKN